MELRNVIENIGSPSTLKQVGPTGEWYMRNAVIRLLDAMDATRQNTDDERQAQ